MNKSFFLPFIGLGLILTVAFSPLQKISSNPVFMDDFEKYSTDKDIKKAYTVWEDGAALNVTLQKTLANSGKQALGVEIVSPNPNNQSVDGSIYHVLPLLQRNWSNGSGVRFWVNNSTIKPLILSFNFKEAYNEYWAVASSGVFFLQNKDGDLLQQDIQFGNLTFPASYQGFVVIPFFSFAVPDWNTARGDKIMNLSQIESFAIAVNIGEDFQRSFVIDDIEILPPTDFKTLVIQGAGSIQIPSSGEHREQYTAHLGSSLEKTSSEVTSTWSLRQPHDPLITIDDRGSLIIPADAKGERITLVAKYNSPENNIADEFTVMLNGSQASPQGQIGTDAPINPTKVEDSAYTRFSNSFELWAVENRPLFVLISIGVILLILFVLSLFQRRIK